VRLEVSRWQVDGGHDIEQTNLLQEAKTVVTYKCALKSLG
jgi:hypothetical protein